MDRKKSFSKSKDYIEDTAFGKSLIIIIIYIIFGCAWILLSDSFAEMLVTDRADLVLVNTLKGLLYVGLTAALIFGLTYPAFKKIIAAQTNLRRTNEDLENSNLALINERNKLLTTEASRHDIEKSLLESQRSNTVLLENIPGMVYRCKFDRDWTMHYVSNGSYELTGYMPDSLVDNYEIPYGDLIVPKYREYIWDKWGQILKQHTSFMDEYEILTADGKLKWVWEQGRGVYDENGNVLAIEGLILDVTTRKAHEHKLTYMSEHNEITGLYNRSKCEELLSVFLKQYEDKQKAFIIIRLTRFNLINITHGYQYGELLLKNISVKLRTFVAGHCYLFHISGDRFAFFITGYTDQAELVTFSEDVEESLEELLSAHNIKCSIGIVEIENSGIAPHTILKYASIAAEYEDSNQLKSIRVFNRDMEEAIRRLDIIKNELADCARKDADNRLFLVYQPIISAANGRIHGFEALARFTSTEYGLIPPLEFIPIAEETRLIVPLGNKIMKEAFRFMRNLLREGFRDVLMAVNVSAIQLLRDDFLTDLTRIIKETAITPSNICIEITESYFSDNYIEINEKLSEIRSLGITVALDDFGIGYSSLARERELHIDCLKIDKYFVDKLLLLGDNETITSDIISMAHKLGHSVVAEGVEEERQRQYLLEHHCDYLQGYLFSRPVSPDKALALLKSDQDL